MLLAQNVEIREMWTNDRVIKVLESLDKIIELLQKESTGNLILMDSPEKDKITPKKGKKRGRPRKNV